MNRKTLKELRRDIQQVRANPANRKSADLAKLATRVKRVRHDRGKEPTWIRTIDPALSPPLSIPQHSVDMKLGTVRSICDALLDDCDSWSQFLQDQEAEDTSDPQDDHDED